MAKEKKISIPVEDIVDEYETSFGTIKIKRDISVEDKSSLIGMVCASSIRDGEYYPAVEDALCKGLYLAYYITNVEAPTYVLENDNGAEAVDMYASGRVVDAIFDDPCMSHPPESYFRLLEMVDKAMRHELECRAHKLVMKDFVTAVKETGVVIGERISAMTDLINGMDAESLSDGILDLLTKADADKTNHEQIEEIE